MWLIKVRSLGKIAVQADIHLVRFVSLQKGWKDRPCWTYEGTQQNSEYFTCVCFVIVA